MKSQKKEIKKWLQEGRTITPLKALELFKCLRLSARIYELRNEGINIKTTYRKNKNGKRFAEYKLIKN